MPRQAIQNRTRKSPSAPLGLPNRRRTRSITAPERKAEAARLQELVRKEAEALRRQREQALAKQHKAPDGTCGDRKFHLAFVQMGQGDCTIISTPMGKTLMIDCGSDATEMTSGAYLKRIQSLLYSLKFLGRTNVLNYLIFTHPDSDHYNKLSTILYNTTKVYNVYHSSKITSYSVAKTSAWVKDRVKPENITYVAFKDFIKAVSLNEEGAKINGETETTDGRGAIPILQESNCVVSILCSNVSTDTAKDNSNDTNRGSVVTLVETFGKKILICGDATRSTEAFLLKKYSSGTLLNNIDIAQAPHHGSAVTSSSDAWVKKVKPPFTVISAGKNVVKDHLPSLITITKYFGIQEDNTVANHELYYWDLDFSRYTITSSFTQKALYITGSSASQIIDIDNTSLTVGV